MCGNELKRDARSWYVSGMRAAQTTSWGATLQESDPLCKGACACECQCNVCTFTQSVKATVPYTEYDFVRKSNENESFCISADAVGTNLFFKKGDNEKMTYFCKGTKKVNLQRVILKKRRQEVVTSPDTPAAKQAKCDSSELCGVSPGPSSGPQHEDLGATDLIHSEQGMCKAVERKGESTHSQDVLEVADSNADLTGPCDVPNLTESYSE